MRIALYQLNYTINDISGNLQQIRQALAEAERNKVDLAVFSELSICGYPPQDLLEREDFVEQCRQAINSLAADCNTIAAIVGGPSINPAGSGKQLFNSAFFLSEGRIIDIHHKGLLPTYDIFDEYRYFEPCKEFHTTSYKGQKLAITICEDLWDDQPVTTRFGKSRLYPISPMEALTHGSSLFRKP
ncbi:MAG TPA: nitrilase-related carbon-nitrogen hydrolase [Williamwhitmania sp.]|nr:nitrilase-related carbon-nitrogen hydrolase [Williamwhitmania sp.]